MERAMKKYMAANKGAATDARTGEVCATTLAEMAAAEFDCHELLDSEDSFIWDLAGQIAWG